MSKTTVRIKASAEAIDEVLAKREWDRSMLCQKMGMPNSTFSDHLNGKGFEPMAYRLMCMILGKSEEELLYKEPEVKPESEVSSILGNNAVMEAIVAMHKDIKSIKDDLLILARVVADIQKQVIETKAQGNMSADDIKAIENKATEINSTVNKISGHLNAKFRTK